LFCFVFHTWNKKISSSCYWREQRECQQQVEEPVKQKRCVVCCFSFFGLSKSYKIDDAAWIAGFDVKAALQMAVQVLSKSMDSTSLTSEKLEFATVTREKDRVIFTVLSKAEVDKLIASVPTVPNDNE
jgi:hypothetical protein